MTMQVRVNSSVDELDSSIDNSVFSANCATNRINHDESYFATRENEKGITSRLSLSLSLLHMNAHSLTHRRPLPISPIASPCAVRMSKSCNQKQIHAPFRGDVLIRKIVYTLPLKWKCARCFQQTIGTYPGSQVRTTSAKYANL